MELSSVQQSQEEREERIEELARLNQQLEQETIKQKHLLQLEKLKTENVCDTHTLRLRLTLPPSLPPPPPLSLSLSLPLSQELKDVTEQKTRLMSELEKEKEKLERDIQQLEANKVSRNSYTKVVLPLHNAHTNSI